MLWYLTCTTRGQKWVPLNRKRYCDIYTNRKPDPSIGYPVFDRTALPRHFYKDTNSFLNQISFKRYPADANVNFRLTRFIGLKVTCNWLQSSLITIQEQLHLTCSSMAIVPVVHFCPFPKLIRWTWDKSSEINLIIKIEIKVCLDFDPTWFWWHTGIAVPVAMSVTSF